MKTFQLLALLSFFILNFTFAQLASDYYPLHIGNYWIQHADSISFEYQPTTFRKEIVAIDLIGGEEHFQFKQTRMADDGSSSSTKYFWYREDSTGILLGGFGETGKIDSATIFDPPPLWLPNEIVNVGYTWEVNAPEMGGNYFFAIGSIRDTVEVSAGTFHECVRIHGLIVDTSGDSTQFSLAHYAKDIGEISGIIYIRSLEFYEFELIEYNIFPTTDVNNLPGISSNFSMQQNYPNPFNPTTTISFALPEQSLVRLTVFDIRGKEVVMLEDAAKPPGTYEAQWNGVDQSGNPLSTGMYFCRLQAGNYNKTIKMVYLK